MIQIEVTGFQSIERLKLNIDGFTALVGRSNIGKSAVIRALKCALTNSLGTSFVRHGVDCARTLRDAKSCKCYASVHILTDGFDLLWEKGDAVNRYTFNKQVYDSPGQGLPEFLVANGFSPVKIGDTFGNIQIADQFFPIFLLNQSGPSVAEAISDVSHLDRISKATKAVEKDRREAMSTRKVREKDASELRIRLTKYDGLGEADDYVAKVVDQLEKVESLEELVSVLSRYAQGTKTLGGRVRDLTKVCATDTPSITHLTPIAEKVTLLYQLTKTLKSRILSVKALSWVDEFSSKVPDIELLTKKKSEFSLLVGWVSRLHGIKSQFTRLAKVGALVVPDLEGGVTLQKKVLDLTLFGRRRGILEESIRKASFEVSVPDLDSVLTLQKSLADLSKYSFRVSSLSSQLATLTEQEDSASSELSSVLKEIESLGVCPTCTQQLRVGHLHV